MANQRTTETKPAESVKTSDARALVVRGPDSGSSTQSLHLIQRAIGNRALGKIIRAKLEMSQPGDEFEQEADLVADHVVRMPTESSGDEGEITGEPHAYSAAKDVVFGANQFAPDTGRGLPTATETGHQAYANPDKPASGASNNSVQARMETRFGIEPGSVRVHTGDQATRAARLLNARAFTVGNDIVFGSGEYSQSTAEGQRLLAHEMAHVARQHQSSVPARTLMREVKVPSVEHVSAEIFELRMRLAALIQEEQAEARTLAERATVEHRLAWLEGIAAAADPTRRKSTFCGSA